MCRPSIKQLITEKEIQDRVSQLAHIVSRDANSGKLHVLFVLKGAFMFCADFIRALSKYDVVVTVDYVIAKSYVGTESSGKVEFSLAADIGQMNVLLLEDIIDTGITLKTLKEQLSAMQPKSPRLFLSLISRQEELSK